ncbi:hypothetical protein PP707_01235 [Acetobacter pasteurianus]|nr:hypothetical protein [Acetobacter pasteurianus]
MPDLRYKLRQTRIEKLANQQSRQHHHYQTIGPSKHQSQFRLFTYIYIYIYIYIDHTALQLFAVSLSPTKALYSHSKHKLSSTAFLSPLLPTQPKSI